MKEPNHSASRDCPPNEVKPSGPRLQYSLRGLILLTTVVALLFGTARWLGMSAEAGAMLLAVLVIAGAAAFGLWAAVLREGIRSGPSD